MNQKTDIILKKYVAYAPNLTIKNKRKVNGEFPTGSNSTPTSMAKMPILVESQPMDNSLGSIKKKWITHSYFIKTSFHSDKNTPKRKIKNLTHVDHFLY